MNQSTTHKPYRPRGPRARVFGAMTPADRAEFLAVCAEHNYRPTSVIEELCIAFSARQRAKREGARNG